MTVILGLPAATLGFLILSGLDQLVPGFQFFFALLLSLILVEYIC